MDDQTNGTITELHPTKFLEDKDKQALDHDSVALVILNCPIDNYEYFKRLYDHSGYTICADGGANRLHNLLLKQFPNEPVNEALSKAKPHLIHGDLDSLKDEVRNEYSKIGVEISKDSDQYSTDFTKAVKKIAEKRPKVKDVLMLGSIGGRVDQGIGLLHEMYREQNSRHPELRFWFFSESSVSVLLQPGTTIIHTPLAEELITRNVGILPLYGKAVVTLKGFEWDVEDWPTEMGGQMSTSNHIMADQLRVTTDTAVLFTVERQVGG